MSRIGRRRTVNTRSVRASQGGTGTIVRVNPSLNRQGAMSKKVVKHLLSGVYYEGIKIVLQGGEIMDIVDPDVLMSVALKTGVSYVSDEFIAPMIVPMIPVQDPNAQKFLGPAINAGVAVGAAIALDRIDVEEAPMEFFYCLGSNIAADMSLEAVTGVLGI